MRKLTLIFIMLAATAQAEWLPLNAPDDSQRPEFVLIDHSAAGDVFEMILPGVELTSAYLDGKRWDRVEIYGGGFDQEIGMPEAPHVTRLVAIPATAGVRVYAEILEERMIPGIELMPAQGIAPDEGPEAGRLRHWDQAVFAQDRFYPDRLTALGEPAIMRGLRVIPVQINPVSYNPVTKELRIAQKMQMRLTYEGRDPRNTTTRAPRRFSPSWANLARSSILNFDDVGEVDATLTGSYLVICENDAVLVNLINNQFVDWKRRKGHTVVVQTFSPGASNSTIQAMIQSAYNTWDPPPEFVLLVGDSDGEYVLPGWESYVLDHPYAQLEGSDLLADVAIGRMPAGTNSEAATLLNKVIWYEKQPYTGHEDWFHQGVLVASEATSGISTIQTKRWIKTRMIQHDFTRIDTLWYTMGGSVVTVVSNAINGGVTYFNYRGYLGMSGWQNSNTYALTNGYMLPFVSNPTCGTGGFSGESKAEAFAIAGTPTTGQGGVAAYGTATSGTNTRCNNVVDVGTYYGIFDEDINEAGNALNRGKLELYNAYITVNSGYVSNFSLWNNLAGDPGLELWTGPLQIITAEVPDEMEFGENQLQFTVLDTLDQPVEGALVCAYKANEMQVTALTEADGVAQLLLDPITAGNVKITVTKMNCKPILDSLNLVQQAVQLGYYSSAVDDDNLGESQGDNDHAINPGETVEIPIMLKNFGSSTGASGIVLVAATTDSFVNPGDMVETYNSIAPGAVAQSLDDIDFEVDFSAPVDHVIHFELTINSSQGSWISGMDLTVTAPLLQAGSSATAGGDSALSAGETAEMIITTRNFGSDAATGVTAILRSLNSWITVNDSLGSYGNIAIGAAANNLTDHFSLSAAPEAPRGWDAPMRLEYRTSDGFAQADTFTIPLDAKISSDPQGPDEYGYYCYDNTDVNYPPAPTYSWVEIDLHYGGSGTQLPLYDYGEDQDMSVNVGLPFTFQYYGMETDSITVCVNGWVSMVANPAMNLMRNWPIPSCMGPDGMVAPFWDDLVTTGAGRIYYYADTVNHRAIVEWSRMPNWGNQSTLETFEVILYDPDYYPTPTGDGEILFQYMNIVEVVGQYYDNAYSTVGIENPEQNDGIEIVYSGQYRDPAAAVLQNERAYFFTTRFDYQMPDLQIALTPQGGPIVIAPGGGSFNYDVAVHNSLTQAASGEVWCDILLPGGTVYGPVLGPANVLLPADTTMLRARTQNIPGSAPAGDYEFRGYVGIYPFVVWDEASFPFSKSGLDENGPYRDWLNSGEPFEEVGEASSAAEIPTQFALDAAHPNPFNPATAISYQLAANSHVRLQVYDMAGRLVTTLVEGWRSAGYHEVIFDGAGLASGIYLYRLQAGDFTAAGKMLLIK
jgi:hypothetical protein